MYYKNKFAFPIICYKEEKLLTIGATDDVARYQDIETSHLQNELHLTNKKEQTLRK